MFFLSLFLDIGRSRMGRRRFIGNRYPVIELQLEPDENRLFIALHFDYIVFPSWKIREANVVLVSPSP